MKTIEDILCDQVYVREVLISEENQEIMNSEFEECMDLLDNERSEKMYDWNSDIRLPEYASHVLTQSSLDVGQYFQTREFVTAYLEDGSEDAQLKADAATELINRTLNRRDLYHYQKFVRAKGINNVIGRVWAKCRWEQKTVPGVVGSEVVFNQLPYDIDGNPIIDPENQIPQVEAEEIEIMGDVPIIDQFDYDIYDQRNVFTDNSYAYSPQQKKWITFRSEMTISELEEVAESNGYFNLDELRKIKPPEETRFKQETINEYDRFSPVTSSIEQPYDIYERYGRFWYNDGKTGEKAIGLDEEGKPKKNAILAECIITIAVSGSKKVLIGFRKTPFVDATGIPYKPVLRGLCYIDFVKDAGVGDGKYTKSLQVAIDDTFNISQDRVMLATLPTLKTNKHAIQDTSTIYFEPGHSMELNSPDDVQEFKISDNIIGALNQISMLTDKMQQVDSIQPPQMGDTGAASTTATAFAGAFRATGERTNYKSLTFEFTFLCDMYWMIQQMTYRFAKPQTGIKLMGDKVYDFDPTKNYYYKAVSQSIEPEHSKAAKRNELTTMMGYLAQLIAINPGAIRVMNHAIYKFFTLFGDEHSDVVKLLMNQEETVMPEGPGGGVGMVANNQAPVSNQNMLPMSGPELDVRGMANIGQF